MFSGTVNCFFTLRGPDPQRPGTREIMWCFEVACGSLTCEGNLPHQDPVDDDDDDDPRNYIYTHVYTHRFFLFV